MSKHTDWKNFNYAEWKKLNEAFDYKGYDEASQKVLDEGQNLEFSKIIEQLLESTKQFGQPPFKPHAMYNEPGDQIEVYLSNVDYYAHWLCPGIKLHLDMKTNEIVGVTIEGIARLLKKDTEKEKP